MEFEHFFTESDPGTFPAMTRSTGKNKIVWHKVDERHISPDDVMRLLRQRDEREAMDTRTPAQVWLGDPPPHRSALAQRDRR